MDEYNFTDKRLILAAGSQTRWNHEIHADIPEIKQLIEVKGEILIERIQRQFPGSIVITHLDAIKQFSKMVFNVEQGICTLNTLLDTHLLWGEWTTILLGDVDYGKDTIRKIKTQKQQLQFYGTKEEIFAVKWSKAMNDSIIMNIGAVVNHGLWSPKFGKLWNLYRSCTGTHFRFKDEIKKLFTFVSDSQDFDTQAQYIKYAKKQRIRK
jgi:hypothetical protein